MAERIVPKSIQKFDSHVKFFLLVVSFQAASASCFHCIDKKLGFIWGILSA